MVVIALTAALYGFTKDSLPYLWLLPLLVWFGLGCYSVYLVRQASRAWDDTRTSPWIFHVLQYVAIAFAIFQAVWNWDFRLVLIFACVIEWVLLFFYFTYFILSLAVWRRPPVAAWIGFVMTIASLFIAARHYPD